MSVAKHIEVTAESNVSWEDAAKKAVETASKSVHNISGLYVKDMKAVVTAKNITAYRLNAVITFVLE